MKKATDLKSLKELKLNRWSLYKIEKKNYELDQLIKVARKNYYNKGGRINRNSVKWLDSLTVALDRAGYIRHDLTPDTFAVGRLYRRINSLSGINGVVFTSYNELDTNEKYESCQCFTVKEYWQIREVLRNSLNYEEFFAITRHYGFYGERWSYGSIAKAHNTTSYAVRQAIRRAQQKIATNGLPPLVYPLS